MRKLHLWNIKISWSRSEICDSEEAINFFYIMLFAYKGETFHEKRTKTACSWPSMKILIMPKPFPFTDRWANAWQTAGRGKHFSFGIWTMSVISQIISQKFNDYSVARKWAVMNEQHWIISSLNAARTKPNNYPQQLKLRKPRMNLPFGSQGKG